MGQASQIIGAVGSLDCCGTWAKYVCNAAKCHSRCGNLCDLEVQTEKVDLPESDSDPEVEVESDCCNARIA